MMYSQEAAYIVCGIASDWLSLLTSDVQAYTGHETWCIV